ncbi:MAG: DNA polymerase I [Defluviitaleaceae bacterium]|nr:DNA polymerase I [Defluviitaleaceae bacterium]
MKILLFDGFSIMNRAFYALPPLTNSSGEFTNAIYGFLNIFFRFTDEERPDFVTVAFDLPVPTFRHEMYGAYKGTRKGMPDELRAQVPALKGLLEKMGVTLAQSAGFEADDVLGTLAVKAAAQGISPVIITGDRDMLQLASDKIKIRIPKTKAGKTLVEDYNAAEVLEKYGVTPAAFVDVKALMGDTSDNIPGVPGIGEVTATKIIAQFGTLENAIANAAEIKPKRASENLAEFREQAVLSRALAAISLDAPVELSLPDSQDFFNEDAREEVRRLELKSLYKRFGFDGDKRKSPEGPASNPPQGSKPPLTPDAREGSPRAAPALVYDVIKSREEAKEFFGNLVASGESAVFFPLREDEGDFLVGLAIAVRDASAPAKYFHIGGELTLSGFDGELTEADLLAAAKPWLESDAAKLVFDAKNEIGWFGKFGIAPRNIMFDASLAAYVLDGLNPAKTPADIAATYLNEASPTIEEILDNKGKRAKDRKTVAGLPEEIAAKFAAGAADIIARAAPIMEKKLAENSQEKLLREIEMPLAFLLAEIEAAGIKVSKSALEAFGAELDKKIAVLTGLIHDFAGEEFNINSPAQLGEVLFGKLGLRGGKKTQKGYSTAADVLEKIKNAHPIVPLILQYRAYTKLNGTYVDGVLPLIRPKTSRIHSTFHQSLTATGRLSSAEPNLQNIPVRTELGRELRRAFVPAEGCVFVAADYSQIELRLLAHMSGDEVLIRAFREGEDIHLLTASQVFGVSPGEVTAEQRSNAKAVNFGIIYGISAFGLGEDLKIPTKEAESYIAGYFAKYPGVKKYLDETIDRAKTDGFVSTLYNRRRAVAELRSSNFNIRGFGERVAMNMPIQGTAADIIKIAMLNVSARLKREGLAAQIILQIHDELLLEVPTPETDGVVRILKEEMQNAAELSVPLVADVHAGGSWYEV